VATHYGKGAEFQSNVILGSAHYSATVLRPCSDDARVPVILSAVAIEAFFHELCWILDRNVLGARGDASLETLKETLVDLEGSRAPLRTKIRISHFLLSGEHLAKGHGEYQDLDLLIRMRDAMVHPKVPTFDLGNPKEKLGYKLVRELAARRLIPANSENSGHAWTRDALVEPVAKWSVNVARGGILALVRKLPEGHETRSTFESLFEPFETFPDVVSDA